MTRKKLSKTPITRVICLGNLLHGDDGVGYHIYLRLLNSHLPSYVEVLDGRTGGLALIPMFKYCDHVILVDMIKPEIPNTIEAGDEIETGKKYGKSPDMEFGNIMVIPELNKHLKSATPRGLPQFEHGGSLLELIAMLDIYLAAVPEITFIGVIGKEIEAFSAQINPRLHKAINASVAKILKMIEGC